ncbi:inhibitor of apoptosis-promoting Bax1-domain-containing protein [Phakopsora pachyrhizi]|uniref:Inhibitor of apoptosis-promoting Bax1-domain-containing protein n=1 Tax=Phakopsora pachyrhizi TaxID=170000 RepID=A0AAV0BVM7_PHAPC|nr:inhibitor of apoptosis-promoting Bax1-domain-containing protein [Phakopsora pachyrhizi]
MSSNPYPIPPPSYSTDESSKKPDDQRPLLSTSDQNQQSPAKIHPSAGWAHSNLRTEWGDDVERGGVPDDFIGATVSQSSIEIRMAFIRKVYSILFLQIVATAIVASFMRLDASRAFLLEHSWTIFIPLIGALVSMLMLYAKRHSSPANLILLSIFTVLEAIGLGAAVAFVNTMIILEALCLTGLVFIGLTLYTLQTKRDFSGMAPYLGTALMVLIFSSFLTIFFPLSRTMDAIYAGVGTLIFSAYIVFDTQMICKHLSPDDWVVACVSLYLDAVNLFINIVRVLSDLQER